MLTATTGQMNAAMMPKAINSARRPVEGRPGGDASLFDTSTTKRPSQLGDVYNRNFASLIWGRT
jgi:hypothetical protein